MTKLKLAVYWSASCGGCDVAILDIAERVLDLIAIADIVFWPMVADFKYKDVEAMADDGIDVCLFNGGVRNSEQEKMAKLLRAKSNVLVAYGSCACFGGIPSLVNLYSRAKAFERAYVMAPTNVNVDHILPQTTSNVPEGELELPDFWDTVLALHHVVRVEYFVPGCPPPVELTNTLVDALASEQLPPPGTVLGSDKSLCDECERVKEDKKITRIYRPYEIDPDGERCLLEQGLVCMGPATRGGCGQRCIRANMPCRGCFGPAPNVIDQGAKMLSALASIFDAKDDGSIKKMLTEVVDPAGSFNRFTLSACLLRGRRF